MLLIDGGAGHDWLTDTRDRRVFAYNVTLAGWTRPVPTQGKSLRWPIMIVTLLILIIMVLPTVRARRSAITD